MISDIIIPDLGGTDTVTLDEWLVSSGDFVKAGTPIALVTTAKATVEIECFRDGYIHPIVAAKGQSLELGFAIAHIAESLEEIGGEESITTSSNSTSSITVMKTETAIPPRNAVPPTSDRPTTIKASPLARRLARENGLKISELSGSGPQGERLKQDVLRAVAQLHQSAHNVTPLSQFHLSVSIDATESLLALERISKHCPLGSPKPTLTDLVVYLAARILAKQQLLEGETEIIKLTIETMSGQTAGVIERPATVGLREIARRVHELRSKEVAEVTDTNAAFGISCVELERIKDFFQPILPPAKMLLSFGQPQVCEGEDSVRNQLTAWVSVDSTTTSVGDAANYLEDLRRHLENPFDLLLLF